MRTLKLNRKGVSPIIATLLLIVIAVAAAVVTYSFVMGFIGGTSTTNPTTGTMTLDSCTAYTNGTINMYIRNAGSKALTIDYIYINGNQTNVVDISLAVGTVVPISANVAYLNVSSNSVRVTCTDGTKLEFSVQAVVP